MSLTSEGIDHDQPPTPPPAHTTAATEAVKRMFKSLPTEAFPAAALVFGLLAGLIYIAPGDTRMGALYGIAIVLASTGLYSGGKAVAGKS